MSTNDDSWISRRSEAIIAAFAAAGVPTTTMSSLARKVVKTALSSQFAAEEIQAAVTDFCTRTGCTWTGAKDVGITSEPSDK